ncbi:MAG: Anaerobic sulfatase-maturating enzyme [Candidatus Hydrogenedentes bacterium ADurb.Bin179]|nr:MAG: Anaerobic sulfatase-maturating enzyme [Candidatus Hydrogenedentes bacterium ADurb.Bin179]
MPDSAHRYEDTGFHVMAKPVGPSCNLRCAYCFYHEKYKLYPDRTERTMSDAVLEAYIRQNIEAQQRLPEINFAWQGGEPTLAGLDFFRKATALQQQCAAGKPVHNALQTNGILIDDAWAAFLAEHKFLVGLSLDGPERFHDTYRRDMGGRPTFKRVMASMETLKRHGVDFNILACVNRETAAAPEDVYRFLRAHGSGFIQFIPIVERSLPAAGEEELTLVSPDDSAGALITEWSVRPRDYGRFLEKVFDLWVREDVGKIFVQLFDTALEAWMGYEPSLCFFRDCCGDAMVLEYNGDLYSCDHFVYPEHLLGNLLETPLANLARFPQQRAFGEAKRDRLPRQCRECPVLFVCHGECPKHRFMKTADGEPGLNYLCEAYRHFFTCVDPYMRFMANELRHQRPPANVMEWVRRQTVEAAKKAGDAPNDPCPCGSGKKFKKCCGAAGKV